MSGLQEEYLQHQTKIEQLRLSIQYIRWYLVSLILLCLISAIIFFCYFTSYITNFIWSIGFTILTLTWANSNMRCDSFKSHMIINK
ncbi:hypothetical protein, partial [Acinetobacter baumannii]